LVRKYEAKKYNEDTYNDLRVRFTTPKALEMEDIEDALAWKYGKKDRAILHKNPRHRPIIKDLTRIWPQYLSKEPGSAKSTYEYFHRELGESRFISVSFLSHLLFPSEVPIVDQHNLRALRYFLGIGGVENSIKRVDKKNGWKEIQTLRDFIVLFATKNSRTERDFDKYLMMFGKHVALR
jgi:hypothetical protein